MKNLPHPLSILLFQKTTWRGLKDEHKQLLSSYNQSWVQVHVLVLRLKYRFSCTCTWSLKKSMLHVLLLLLRPKVLDKYPTST